MISALKVSSGGFERLSELCYLNFGVSSMLVIDGTFILIYSFVLPLTAISSNSESFLFRCGCVNGSAAALLVLYYLTILI